MRPVIGAIIVLSGAILFAGASIAQSTNLAMLGVVYTVIGVATIAYHGSKLS
jgi:hypothetical protein